MAIAAVSTPAGTGGIAVVRLSGPDSFEIAQRVWKGMPIPEMKSHTVHLGEIIDSSGVAIDQALITIFRAPNSFTGEDTVEFSLHGSPWIQREALKVLVDAGASPAGPGEFTRMAFLNGRMDLAQAEAVADLLAADSHAAARVALTQMEGSYSSRLNSLRERLIELGALLELELDFSEEDVEFADRSQLRQSVKEIREEVVRLMSSYSQGRIFKEGVSVVLAGLPNAGKSSLLNRLVGEEKALVTDVAGTTRDVIEATAEIDGVLFRLYDTAGLRESSDLVEALGVDRAKERLTHASIILWVQDPTQLLAPQLAELESVRALAPDAHIIPLRSKSDLDIQSQPNDSTPGLPISSATGQGIDVLRQRMAELASGDVRPTDTVVTNLRHYEALRASLPYLDRLLAAFPTQESNAPTTHYSSDPSLLAEDLRAATHHIGEITGAITTSDLLSSIFSRFCIGK